MADSATTPAATVVSTDDGSKGSMGRHKGLSVQVAGTFGSATAVLQGSNDGTNYVTARLAQQVASAGVHDAASFTSAGAAKVLDDAFRYYRMSTSGGTSSA